MRLVASSLLLVMHSVSVLAYPLEGAWQSDREKTLKWNMENRIVERDYLNKLATILGSHVMAFGKENVCAFLMPQEYSYNEQKVPIYGMVLGNTPYEIVAQNEHGFVIRHIADDKPESISMLIFENEDSFYTIPLDTEDYGQPGYREYFKRIELPKQVNWSNENCYEL